MRRKKRTSTHLHLANSALSICGTLQLKSCVFMRVISAGSSGPATWSADADGEALPRSGKCRERVIVRVEESAGRVRGRLPPGPRAVRTGASALLQLRA
jgi:hypothetical protein